MIAEEIKVCADHMKLRVCPLLVGDDAMEVSSVIMSELLVTSMHYVSHSLRCKEAIRTACIRSH